MSKNSKNENQKPGSDKKPNSRENNNNGKKRTGSKPEGTPAPGQDKQSKTVAPWNDPAWYNRNPALTEGAANFSFNTALGSNTLAPVRTWVETTGDTITQEEVSIPGVFAYRIHPTVGLSEGNGTEPMNVAFQKLYTATRKTNSGSAPYEAVDEGLYLLRMDSIYSYHSFLCRIYGTISYYSSANRYLPDALLMANHVDPESIRKNITQLRDYINVYALKANTIKVPNSFTLLNRHYQMYGSYYLEEEGNPRSQIYTMVPDGFFRFAYNDTDEGQGSGKLVYTPLPARLDFAALVRYGDELLDAAFSDVDVSIISGDILKAFEEGNCYALAQIASDYTAPVVFESDMLTQLMNATCVGDTQFLDDEIVQNSKAKLVYQPRLVSNEPAGDFAICTPVGVWLNLRSGNHTTPDWIMEYTRLSTVIYVDNKGGNQEDPVDYKIHTCGTEIVCGMEIYTLNSDTGITTVVPVATSMPSTWNDPASGDFRLEGVLAFDYHPPIYWVHGDRSVGGPVMDFDNYRFLTPEEMERINGVALLSQFDI